MFQSRIYFFVNCLWCEIHTLYYTITADSLCTYEAKRKKNASSQKCLLQPEKNRAEQRKKNTPFGRVFCVQLSCQRYRNSWMHDCFTLSIFNYIQNENQKRLFLYAYDEVFGPVCFLFCFVLFCFFFLRFGALTHSFAIDLFFPRFLWNKTTLFLFTRNGVHLDKSNSTWEFHGITITNRATNNKMLRKPHSYRKQEQYLQKQHLKILCIFSFTFFGFCYYSLSFIYLFAFCCFFSNTVYNLFADHTIVHSVRARALLVKEMSWILFFVINFYQREQYTNNNNKRYEIKKCYRTCLWEKE